MTQVKRGNGVAMFAVLLIAVSILGYGVAAASGNLGSAGASSRPTASATTTAPTPTPSPSITPGPVVTPTPTPTATVPAEPEEPAQTAGAAVLAPGDSGPRVRAAQSRLRQLQWYFGDVSDSYDAKTSEAVKGFQAKRGLPATGSIDQATLARLVAMTHEPTKDELANKPTDGSYTSRPLDDRCRTGRALCVDKTSRTVRWVVDGHVLKTMAVRFGSQYTPTREGLFRVNSKSPDHVSTLFHTPMPFAMFFSRGQAVHYSSDFAARGYNGASHGCVNVKDYEGIKWLFSQVQVGDKVVVYWS